MPVEIARDLGLVLSLTLVWLWPHTFGPVAGVEPYLVSMALAAVALALWPAHDAARATRMAAWAWLAAALLSSLVALAQYFALLQYFNLEARLYPVVNIAAPGLAFGNLRQPNHLASLLVIGILALRWLVQDARLSARWVVPMVVPMAVALAATASRTGLAELLACGALVLWWAFAGRRSGGGRRAWLMAGGALALYALAALALPLLAQSTEGVAGRDLVERLRTAEGTCGSRLILWRNVLHLIGLKPWTGWGWGELSYAHYMTLYDGPRFCYIVDNAHNLPLHLAVTLGLPAALAACALLAWLVWRGRPWAEQQPARQLAWGVLLAIGIHSLVEYPLWYGPFQIAAVICVWLLWATRQRAQTQAARSWPRHLAAAALLAAVAYAGWDYFRIAQVYLPPGQQAALYRDDPLGHALDSWLFADVARFAEVTSQPVRRDNAAWMLPMALLTLHYSPESRVITRVIESATYLGYDDLALGHLRRFRAAFPREYRQWVQDNRRPPGDGPASGAASGQ